MGRELRVQIKGRQFFDLGWQMMESTLDAAWSGTGC
jgi:hypothetical protein